MKSPSGSQKIIEQAQVATALKPIEHILKKSSWDISSIIFPDLSTNTYWKDEKCAFFGNVFQPIL